MARRILDTCILGDRWRRFKGSTPADPRRWAEKLVTLRNASRILPPAELEFLAGIRSEGEMALAEAYLGTFITPPNGQVREEDWLVARNYARRVPRDGKPRQIGDCLIRAVANRLRLDVDTFDTRFAR
jgi:predicted nucleic acid-binding protein